MYDLIIIGGGPAGLTAGIYAVRYGLDTLILERNEISGQISMADIVENYPGFPSISGLELMERFRTHAQEVGVKPQLQRFFQSGLKEQKNYYNGQWGPRGKSRNKYHRRKSKTPWRSGEKELISRESPTVRYVTGLFQKQNCNRRRRRQLRCYRCSFPVKSCQKVYLVHRRDHLKAARVLQDRVDGTPNIELILNSHVWK